jgi:membrane protease YdiL (CAAX protease family)
MNEAVTENIIPLKPDKDERRSIRRLYSASGIALLLFLLYQMLFGDIVVNALASLFTSPDSAYYYTVGSFISISLTIIFEICAIFIGAKLLHIKLRSLFGLKGFSGKTIAKTYFAAQGGGYLFAFVGAIIMIAMMIFAADIDSMLPGMGQVMASSPAVAAFTVLYGTFGAPILEELFFRGIILTSLKKYNHTFAIIISGLAFGLTHGNIVQATFATYVGILFGAIALRFNSIVPTIFAHAIVNIVGMGFNTLLNATDFADIYSNLSVSDMMSISSIPQQLIITMIIMYSFIFVIGITSLVIFITNIKRFREFFHRATPLGKSRGLPVFVTSVPWVICCGILIYSVFVTPFLTV